MKEDMKAKADSLFSLRKEIDNVSMLYGMPAVLQEVKEAMSELIYDMPQYSGAFAAAAMRMEEAVALVGKAQRVLEGRVRNVADKV